VFLITKTPLLKFAFGAFQSIFAEQIAAHGAHVCCGNTLVSAKRLLKGQSSTDKSWEASNWFGYKHTAIRRAQTKCGGCNLRRRKRERVEKRGGSRLKRPIGGYCAERA